MSDEQVRMRAAQEYAFKTGKIPTTKAGGATQSAGDTLATHSKAVGAVVGGAGVLTGNPLVVAAAPMVGRGVQAAGEYLAGRPVTRPSAGEVAVLAGEGVLAGYAPLLAEKALTGFAKTTVPHISPISGKYVPGLKGSGAGPWAGRAAAEAAQGVADKLHSVSKAVATVPSAIAVSQSADQLAEDFKVLQIFIASGKNPAQAAAQIANGNPKRFGALMTAYMQSRQVK